MTLFNAPDSASPLPQTFVLLQCLHAISKMALFYLFVFLPATLIIYSSFENSSTHENVYNYSVSGMYISGFNPALALTFISVFFCFAFFASVQYFFDKESDLVRVNNQPFPASDGSMSVSTNGNVTSGGGCSDESTGEVNASDSFSISLNARGKSPILNGLYIVFIRSLFVSCLFSIPLCVNCAYVMTVNKLSPGVVNAVQALIALFNTVFISVAVPMAIRQCSSFLKLSVSGRSVIFSILYFLCCLSVPIVSTLISDSLCFRGVFPEFFGQEEVSSTYSVPTCHGYVYLSLKCAYEVSLEQTLTYSPPFVYSFQCRCMQTKIIIKNIHS